MNSTNLARSWPWSVCTNWPNHSIKVPALIASKCFSNVTWSWPLSPYCHGLQVHIYKLRWLPPSGLHHHDLSVHFQPHFIAASSAKWNLVRKPYANLSDTPVALDSACKYFQMLPALSGALQNALRLCKSILRYSWKRLQWGRCVQDATKFDDYDSQILGLRRPLWRSAGDLVLYSHTICL
jgi:hypothetical protein